MTLMERENAALLLPLTTIRPFTYMSFPLRFKCFYCDEIHPELATLLEHTNNHTAPGRTEMLKSLLKKGKKTIKVDISELKCKLCNAPFLNVDEARCHLSTAHGKKFNPSSGNGMIVYNLKTKDGAFSCHLCSQTFTSFFLLNKHINVHFNNAICELCGKGFVSHQRLIQHKEIHSRGKFHCDKCKISFESPSKFKYHNDRWHRQPKKINNIYYCQHCSARFDHHYEKTRHLSERHGINFEYPCDTCRSVFKNRKTLASHQIKYHIQRIICEICKKPFAQRGHLKKHMAMHTDERNFPCPLCNKRYKYEKNVKSHMRLHNPDWNFACADCCVGFSNKSQFKKHVRDVHQDHVTNKQ
ncbi:unnamed protein product [Diatraea saccharalis]|uniref:C2H2-type domain-containing protein n=1 Tax=Diatraea saccharalis TaxID=40085 RepID=A0A9N9R5A1_9NEOP|nr:unnamed protein product [Diatraea saccharalis]